MEWDKQGSKPLVRIGIFQTEESIDFESGSPFKVHSLEGQFLFSGKAGKVLRVTVGESAAAHIAYRIRFAIVNDKQQTDICAQKWRKQGCKAQEVWVGQQIPLAKGRVIDNREIWILSEPFSSRDEAADFRQTLEDFGSTAIVPQVLEASTGFFFIDGQRVEAGLRLVPANKESNRFLLHNVRVGADFHWDHRETQAFNGELEFRLDLQGKISVINIVSLEKYLTSVNSSEMSPECNIEFLRAQTVAARSTIFATMGKHHWGDPFDLCAGDHCQCFYGVGVIQQNSQQAATRTSGEVLTYEDHICDARYAKLCGGIAESYENVWDDRKIPYLHTFVDSNETSLLYQTVNVDSTVKQFLRESPKVFCNPAAYSMPPHLEYAKQYFQWEVRHSPEEFGELVRAKSGKDLGAISDIIPLKRGYSGRLIYVKLVGEQDTLIVGKELEIRRLLSPKHLYSSCFYVEKVQDGRGQLKELVLKGRGWGHGVGMCQVGAAVMGELGYDYAAILSHYYRGTQLQRIY